MTTPRSYDVTTANRDRDAELARLATQARLGWEKEVVTLEHFGFRDGMSILELGSGPGYITGLLLDRFPAAHVTSVDIDPTLIDDARRHLADRLDRVTFVHGSVEDMALSPDHYDAAYARLLFQHLPDPALVAAEAFRVLLPRAPFVVYDIDDEIWGLTDPAVPGLRTLFQRNAQAQAASGGNRNVGRRLLRLLREAGFDGVEMGVVASNTEEEGLEPFLPMFDLGRLVPLLQEGVVTQEEVDELEAQWAAFLAADRPFILMLTLMAKGRKPERR